MNNVNNRMKPKTGSNAVATGQAQPTNPKRFWDRRTQQGVNLGTKIAPELYDGALPTIADEYKGQNQNYLDLLNQRMTSGMTPVEINQLEDKGMAEIGRATSGAMRGAAQSMAQGGTGMAGGVGNAYSMDLARGVGNSVRGLQSDIAGQNLKYKTDATGQYGGALENARSAGLRVGEGNAKLTRSDLAAKIGMTGTGIGLLEQTRQEGREDKRRGEDMSLQEKLEQMRLEYAKSLGALG